MKCFVFIIVCMSLFSSGKYVGTVDAELDERGRTALMWAIVRGNKQRQQIEN